MPNNNRKDMTGSDGSDRPLQSVLCLQVSRFLSLDVGLKIGEWFSIVNWFWHEKCNFDACFNSSS